ncbi:DUF1700 domain-containing protein [Novosphingobium aquimarinum]|uniref:DUF1700 domain-containing protein n=1 Tax=Novosphingobium aquimarinum TaxID=2682494 RepID=UPI0012EB5AA0|nr:DUF1700 domain-containing protein [Novosphingobium aquimarinum]
MTRNDFIRRLKAGLKGLPAEDISDIVADYEEHFEAGAAEGRSEEEVADALGNPTRLARELRFEAGIRNWQTDRTPSSAFAAVVGFMGLATIDILILLPIVLSVIGIIFALYLAMFALFICGGFVLFVGPLQGFPGGIAAAIFAGLGLMAGSIAVGALLTILSIWVINALLWFGRLHYRVIEPAIKSEDA